MFARQFLKGAACLLLTLILAFSLEFSAPTLIGGVAGHTPEGRTYTTEELAEYRKEWQEFSASYLPPPIDVKEKLVQGITRFWWLPFPVFFVLTFLRRRGRLVDEIPVVLPLLLLFVIQPLTFVAQLKSISSGIVGLIIVYTIRKYAGRRNAE